MKWLAQFFTWWQGQTLNTRLWTWLYGEEVGRDSFGNRYYQTRKGKRDPALGFQRRWVIYKEESEGSKVPPGWYGWLHHTYDEIPSADSGDLPSHPWEIPYRPNLTGTPDAYRPPGSLSMQGALRPSTKDYESWVPPS